MSSVKVLDGTTVRTKVVFTDPDGVVVDPPGVSVSWDGPLAILETYTFGVDLEVVNDGVGLYHMDRPMTGPTEIGQWWVTWNGTPAFAAGENYFYVKDGHL